ncbi:hypothetical protein BPY_00130 [Bifidobacterium psychraerophilum]
MRQVVSGEDFSFAILARHQQAELAACPISRCIGFHERAENILLPIVEREAAQPTEFQRYART